MTTTSPAAVVRTNKTNANSSQGEQDKQQQQQQQLSEKEIKRRIKAARRDISRPALVSEFTESPVFYLALAIFVFFLCWLMSSYVLFPIIFKERLANEPTSKFFRQDNINTVVSSHNIQQQGYYNELAEDNNNNNNNNEDVIENEINLTPQGKVFKPLSNPHPKPSKPLRTQQDQDTPLQRNITQLVPGLVPEVIDLLTKLVKSFPHDRTCFTQGYDFFNGELFESCGLYKESLLRTVNYETGQVLRPGPAIPEGHFAEGLAIRGEGDNAILYLLTWKEATIHRFNPTTWHKMASLPLKTQGWGITIDPKTDELVISDGSANLSWYNPETMARTRLITVKEWVKDNQYKNIHQLNELEWVGGEIWANVWHSREIFCINPNNGQVVRRLNGAGVHLINDQDGQDVMNGIAYGIDHNGDTKLLMTGKLWTKTYELDWTQLVVPFDDDDTLAPIPSLPDDQ